MFIMVQSFDEQNHRHMIDLNVKSQTFKSIMYKQKRDGIVISAKEITSLSSERNAM